ncbi:MAG: hypothetical protein ABFC56_09515 [Clostridiaceae bacterium]
MSYESSVCDVVNDDLRNENIFEFAGDYGLNRHMANVKRSTRGNAVIALVAFLALCFVLFGLQCSSCDNRARAQVASQNDGGAFDLGWKTGYGLGSDAALGGATVPTEAFLNAAAQTQLQGHGEVKGEFAQTRFKHGFVAGYHAGFEKASKKAW